MIRKAIVRCPDLDALKKSLAEYQDGSFSVEDQAGAPWGTQAYKVTCNLKDGSMFRFDMWYLHQKRELYVEVPDPERGHYSQRVDIKGVFVMRAGVSAGAPSKVFEHLLNKFGGWCSSTVLGGAMEGVFQQWNPEYIKMAAPAQAYLLQSRVQRGAESKGAGMRKVIVRCQDIGDLRAAMQVDKSGEIAIGVCPDPPLGTVLYEVQCKGSTGPIVFHMYRLEGPRDFVLETVDPERGLTMQWLRVSNAFVMINETSDTALIPELFERLLGKFGGWYSEDQNTAVLDGVYKVWEPEGARERIPTNEDCVPATEQEVGASAETQTLKGLTKVTIRKILVPCNFDRLMDTVTKFDAEMSRSCGDQIYVYLATRGAKEHTLGLRGLQQTYSLKCVPDLQGAYFSCESKLGKQANELRSVGICCVIETSDPESLEVRAFLEYAAKALNGFWSSFSGKWPLDGMFHPIYKNSSGTNPVTLPAAQHTAPVTREPSTVTWLDVFEKFGEAVRVVGDWETYKEAYEKQGNRRTAAFHGDGVSID